MPKLILASASPRRQSLLRGVGAEFEVFIPDVDETVHSHLPPAEQVLALSRMKAMAAAVGFPDCVIIGADTLVHVAGDILGKPRSKEEAVSMLSRLSGRGHTVYTGVSVVSGDRCYSEFAATEVFFRDLLPEEITRYVETGEPMDKAGAYGIQEKGALLVRRIEGDYFNVMGLPLVTLDMLLRRVGVTLL